MCGIAGILGGPDVPRRRSRVEEMTGALIHRGPDDDGYFDDDKVTLGFRRLAVIDLETGQQPIVDHERKLAIVLNGEIYNFRQLRKELQAKGHRFRTTGDVEVVLRLWSEEGPRCVARLNGMFALAMWDAQCATLYLARDRFGIKPLYLCRDRGELAFASEIRALRAGAFPSSVELDPVQLHHYLSFGFLAPEAAPLIGVRSLPPATMLAVESGGVERLDQYWVPPKPDATALSGENVTEALRAALQRSVEDQLVADVPVGVFLSGGLDSSTLCALAHKAVTGPLRTFSIGFEGPDAVNELPYAREVAEYLGSDHHEHMMCAEDVARDLGAIVDGLDAPLADPTAIPTWYMCRLAREEATVALSGEGADEIFGGYARQRYDVALDRMGGLGRRVLPLVMRMAGRAPSTRLQKRLRMQPGLKRQLDWGRLFSAEQIDRVAMPTGRDEEMWRSYSELAERWLQLADSDPVNGRLMTDREVFLPGDLLPKVDRMSMAHSLEVRVPYLDNGVVDLMLGLSGGLKQSLFKDKMLLRASSEGLLPQEATHRRKRGFEVPIGAWLRGALRPAMSDLLAPEKLQRAGVLRPEVVAEMVEQHLEGRHDHGKQLWALVVLSRWLETGEVR